MDDEALSEDQQDDLAPETPEPDVVARAIVKTDERWKSGQSLTLGSKRWQPSLLRKVGARRSLLHIHVAERLRGYAEERMILAFEQGIEIHVALSLRKLYDEYLLSKLAAVDPLVHIIDEPLLEKPPRLLACLADHQIVLPPATRQVLATAGHTISQAPGTNDQKGKRLEALVAFLASQVDDFRVIERNFRTRTGEIDIVVQQRATSGRLWTTLGAPLILIEAKNRKEPISQQMVAAFRSKMQTSRGGVRLGIMVAAAHVTQDASIHELKFATENLTIAFITKRELDDWIASDDHDGWLEQHFSRAMLR